MADIIDFNTHKKISIENLLNDLSNFEDNVYDKLENEYTEDLYEYFQGYRNALILNYKNLLRKVEDSNDTELKKEALEDLKFLLSTLPEEYINKKM